MNYDGYARNGNKFLVISLISGNEKKIILESYQSKNQNENSFLYAHRIELFPEETRKPTEPNNSCRLENNIGEEIMFTICFIGPELLRRWIEIEFGIRKLNLELCLYRKSSL